MSEKVTFEQAMKRLEEIAGMLESGELPLEQSMALFEEGTKLSAFCNEQLSQFEQKIITLTGEKLDTADSQ